MTMKLQMLHYENSQKEPIVGKYLDALSEA